MTTCWFRLPHEDFYRTPWAGNMREVLTLDWISSAIQMSLFDFQQRMRFQIHSMVCCLRIQTPLSHIHACLGCPLRVDDTLIGVLTADALDPKAFDGMDPRFLKAVGALAGAQMQTANLIDALEKSAERQGLIASDLMQDIHIRQGTQILGGSSVMEHLRREIELVARSDFTVLVLGETGVGKELVVRAIHSASNRKEAPLLYLNCAAMPETLAESELFGHKKGSYTGASRDRAGKFELANNGTLFLDEIGELPLTVQPKLLRAIQDGEIQCVGSDKPSQVDVRLLAATNRNLNGRLKKTVQGRSFSQAECLPDQCSSASKTKRRHSPAGWAFLRTYPAAPWVRVCQDQP
jgi:transcriptional regulator with GAF, ATPase, and Fis domain